MADKVVSNFVRKRIEEAIDMLLEQDDDFPIDMGDPKGLDSEVMGELRSVFNRSSLLAVVRNIGFDDVGSFLRAHPDVGVGRIVSWVVDVIAGDEHPRQAREWWDKLGEAFGDDLLSMMQEYGDAHTTLDDLPEPFYAFEVEQVLVDGVRDVLELMDVIGYDSVEEFLGDPFNRDVSTKIEQEIKDYILDTVAEGDDFGWRMELIERGLF